ncbi:MAG: cell division protein FtsZ [Firmicutes bacterium]|nr:cell division protein FtsZ [Bacillota bacterium]MCM1401081.1 cell division protein FtsZ [Bacteroides sp.]MCM1477000.1 cell division protein FtsZ [Bacteroides sp.]
MDENNLNIDELASLINSKPVTAKNSNDIMVIGVGGGGGNAVNHMYRQGVDRVTFVVCNTDARAVEQSDVPNKVVIGTGRGAGNDENVGKKYAEDDIDKIQAMFNNNTRMVFITAGMGGGTGTGAGPVVARVAHERGLLTVGIVTIPFRFEGKKKILKALEGAEEMKKYVDALLIINNQRLAEIYPDLNFFNAFGKADDTLYTAAKSISEIITTTGYINVDFEDVDRTLRNGGTAIISTGYGEGEHRVTHAIEDALNSPLLRNRDVYGSRSLLLNLYMSRDDNNSMSMTEVQELENFVNDINGDVDIIWGVTIDESLGEKVKVTILAAGFDVTLSEEETKEVLTIPNSNPGGTRRVPAPSAGKKPKIAAAIAIEKEYGNMNIDKSRMVILTPEQMNDDAVIEILEQPVESRDPNVVSSLRKGVLAETLRPEIKLDVPKAPNTSNQIEF